mmetsp:Transcript_9993/g.14716  ORF Transcript_9993/g.14716 Transcript_9993/m.14716 type:complete len:165 (+) Transcript_9993:26-520(+)
MPKNQVKSITSRARCNFLHEAALLASAHQHHTRQRSYSKNAVNIAKKSVTKKTREMNRMICKTCYFILKSKVDKISLQPERWSIRCDHCSTLKVYNALPHRQPGELFYKTPFIPPYPPTIAFKKKKKKKITSKTISLSSSIYLSSKSSINFSSNKLMNSSSIPS